MNLCVIYFCILRYEITFQNLFILLNNCKIMSNKVLEKKLCLAKESPQPIFDLSECGLKKIPTGIFTTIKVLRKECLYLQNNKLTSLNDGNKSMSNLILLKLLDISSNKILKLPSDIHLLQCLQIFKADNNELKSLPLEFGSLSNLEYVSLSSNKLQCLPDSIGCLKNLHHLDIRNNTNLLTLPLSIRNNKHLKTLLLDEEQEWITPPKNIIRDGTDAILKYFAQKCNMKNGSEAEEVNKCDSAIDLSHMLKQLNSYDKILEDNLKRFKEQKEKKLLQNIEAERIMVEQHEKLLHQKNQNAKHKLLKNIVAQQQELDATVSKVHEQRSKDQINFIRQLKSVEKTTDEIIRQLIKTNNENKMKYLKSFSLSLADEVTPKQVFYQQEVLESMKSLFVQEFILMEKRQKADESKKNFTNFINPREIELKNKIFDLLSQRQSDQKRLLNDIKEDNELQCAAVLMLIEKSDDRNIELQNQISLIQNQLSNLTTLELENKRLNINKYFNELAERRAALSELLIDVFTQQQIYKNQVIEKLTDIENYRVRQLQNQKEEYWLRQYQHISEQNKYIPSTSNIALNSSLIYRLALFGVSHCARFLSTFNTETVSGLLQITDQTLKASGMKSKDERKAVVDAVKYYINEKHCANIYPNAPSYEEIHGEEISPTAPELEYLPTDTSFFSKLYVNECVICLSENSDIIYLPCGHFCSCNHCSLKINNCPLCRCDIEQKLQIFNS